MAEQLLPWQQAQWNKLNISREHGRLPHALLMTGPTGLGKQAFARLLGKSLLCESRDTQNMPCGTCKQCRLAAAKNHPDLRDVNPEEAGKAIKVDAVRELVNQSILSVDEARYRVFIIRPAEAMGVAAANALLKTLEEPIQRTLLILISANPGKLLATIKSRCQQLAFTIPPRALAQDWLSERIGKDQAKSADLLQLARGAPLLARQMVESDELQSHNQLLKEFLLLAGRNAEPVMLAEQWQKQQDLNVLLNYMKRWLMDIILFGHGAGVSESSSSSPVADLKIVANRLDLAAVYKLLDSLFETERRLTNNINPQLALEQLLLHWAHINNKGGT
jgi:DNA polymerase-3 subunit delta'